MSISNYAELQTAVSDWLHRNDLSGRAADFIQHGEAWLNRKLRTVDMEERASVVMGTTDRFDTLPQWYIVTQRMTRETDAAP